MEKAMTTVAAMASGKQKQKSHGQRLSIYPWLRISLLLCV
jgi:hypothetical protein